ncbi:MAG: hypothetical protein ABWY47_18495 [Xanthobacteraceae bacterium]|jgi:hypothetical protein
MRNGIGIVETPVTKEAATLGSRAFAGVIVAALLMGVAVAAWSKFTTVSTRAVPVEDRIPAGTRLGGGLYEQPLQF